MLIRRRVDGFDFPRVPTDELLDLASWQNAADYIVEQLSPPCGLPAPRDLERLKGGFLDSRENLALAVHRRILRTTAQGRIVLQDVNTSFVDFVIGVRSLGTIEF